MDKRILVKCFLISAVIFLLLFTVGCSSEQKGENGLSLPEKQSEGAPPLPPEETEESSELPQIPGS